MQKKAILTILRNLLTPSPPKTPAQLEREKSERMIYEAARLLSRAKVAAASCEDGLAGTALMRQHLERAVLEAEIVANHAYEW